MYVHLAHAHVLSFRQEVLSSTWDGGSVGVTSFDCDCGYFCTAPPSRLLMTQHYVGVRAHCFPRQPSRCLLSLERSTILDLVGHRAMVHHALLPLMLTLNDSRTPLALSDTSSQFLFSLEIGVMDGRPRQPQTEHARSSVSAALIPFWSQ